MQIAIVSDSGCGHTEEPARAVAEGVAKVPGAQATPIAVTKGEISTATHLGQRAAEITRRFAQSPFN